jgi:hypothetical protein
MWSAGSVAMAPGSMTITRMRVRTAALHGYQQSARRAQAGDSAVAAADSACAESTIPHSFRITEAEASVDQFHRRLIARRRPSVR